MFLYYATTKVIQPVVTSIPALPQGAVTTAAVSFGISGLVVGGVGYILIRHLRTRESRLVRNIIDEYLLPMLSTISTRLEDIEASSRERYSHFNDRAKALEEHTHIHDLEATLVAAADRKAQSPASTAMSAPPAVVSKDHRLSVVWKAHTSGLSVRVTNLNAEELVKPRLQIADARRWSDSAGTYVKVQEISVIELQDQPTLYCDQPQDFRCLYLNGEKLSIDGYHPKDDRSQITRLDLRGGAGQWRIDLKMKWGDGGRFDVPLFFKWDGRNVPEPL